MGTGSTVIAHDDKAGSIAFWKQGGGTVGDPPAGNPTAEPDVRFKFSNPESIVIVMERLEKLKSCMEPTE